MEDSPSAHSPRAPWSRWAPGRGGLGGCLRAQWPWGPTKSPIAGLMLPCPLLQAGWIWHCPAPGAEMVLGQGEGILASDTRLGPPCVPATGRLGSPGMTRSGFEPRASPGWRLSREGFLVGRWDHMELPPAARQTMKLPSLSINDPKAAPSLIQD